MKKILVVGSSNVDTTLQVDNFPKPGETINARQVTTTGGGKGANQAIAAAKSGVETEFISRVGEDGFGEYMLNQLRSYGVSLEYVETTLDAETGHAYITLNQAGQNDIIIDHGANYQLSASDVEAANELLGQIDCVIAQFETPIPATIAAFKMAKQHEAITILNPAPAIKQIPHELLALTDIIMPNETESAVITGIEIHNEADLQANANYLHKLGIPHVVITYGDKGSYLSSAKINKLIPAFKVPVTDTTGAGDTFIGYFASNLNKELTNIEQAAIIASHASSITVQRLGAQAAIPTAKEVQDLLGEKNG